MHICFVKVLICLVICLLKSFSHSEMQSNIQKLRPYTGSQNVPKSKRTLLESKFTQVRSKLSQVESKCTQCVVKMYP